MLDAKNRLSGKLSCAPTPVDPLILEYALDDFD